MDVQTQVNRIERDVDSTLKLIKATGLPYDKQRRIVDQWIKSLKGLKRRAEAADLLEYDFHLEVEIEVLEDFQTQQELVQRARTAKAGGLKPQTIKETV